MATLPKKRAPKPKERPEAEHTRFVELAKELGADQETEEIQGILKRAATAGRAVRKR